MTKNIRTLLLLSLYILCAGSISGRLWAKSYPFVVVLDAGHGGKDPGARRGSIMEKDITLGVALHLGELIKANHPNIKVLYTRSTDKFVGLQQRADFANNHRASLFLSIHVNSAPSTVSGTETYVLGLDKQQSNLSVALRENKVMELEDNYKTIYKGYNPNSSESLIAFKLMQEAYQERSIELARLVEAQYRQAGRRSRGVRQAPFWVLSQSAMPSILTEIGFISDQAEAQFLSSKEGQAIIARALYRAVAKFYSGAASQQSSATEIEPITEPIGVSTSQVKKTEIKESAPKVAYSESQGNRNNATSYRVQFMAIPQLIDTQDKKFAHLGAPIYRMKYKNVYRYMVGDLKTLAEARNLRTQIKKYYKDAYVISMDKDGNYVGRVE
ncbi:MAG: N-acetylmuramoyl-L-alanine amidase [Porphyromonadaceae bacterium]|nr:N-acetylmuramoyl-L-alanine amidase [Porphyromonadaceae bacterium]